MYTLIRHRDTPTVYFTGRPRDWIAELAVDHADPATWPAAQAAAGLTLTELRDLLADHARQAAQIHHLLATPAGLAARLERQPTEANVGWAQASMRHPARTATASYLLAVGIGPYVATRNGISAHALAVAVARPIGNRLEASFGVSAPFWARALEWEIAETLAPQKGRLEITAGAACDCLERTRAWEKQVRTGPARPGSYRRAAERLDAWYN